MSAAVLVPIILFGALVVIATWLGGMGIDMVAERRAEAKK
jgi:hypothetical protein